MCENNPLLVSVIIPTAQREPSTVLHAIFSVIKQTYKFIEIILVDDNVDIYESLRIKNAIKMFLRCSI